MKSELPLKHMVGDITPKSKKKKKVLTDSLTAIIEYDQYGRNLWQKY